MTDIERHTAAAKFAADWKGRGDEKLDASLADLYDETTPRSFARPIRTMTEP